MGWIETATANLTALSVSKTFAQAKREWRMTYGFNDRKLADGTCGLCEHQDIRYEHEIENVHNHNQLWVGSQCITKFVPVFVHGREIIDEEEKAAHLQSIERAVRQRARQEQAFVVLDALADVDVRFADPQWKSNWKRGYSAKQLQMLVITCREHSVPYSLSLFRINTRRGNVVEQVKQLQLWQYRQLRGAIPPSRVTETDSYFGL
jgi:hypothetical protein